MPHTRQMTVAQVREPEPDRVPVVFLESARFYAVRRDHPGCDRLIARLRKARDDGRPVTVTLASPGSDVIEDVD